VEALRELLIKLVFDIELDGTSKYGSCRIMFYSVQARKEDHKEHKSEEAKIQFYTFRYGVPNARKKSAKLLKELYKVRNKTIEHRKQIVQ